MNTTHSGNVLLWILIGIAIVTTGTATILTVGQETKPEVENEPTVMMEEELPVDTESMTEDALIETSEEEPEVSTPTITTPQPLPQPKLPTPSGVETEPVVIDPPAPATTTATTTKESSEPEELSFRIEADDDEAVPDEITVPHGSMVTLTFFVRTTNTEFGGLNFRAENFSTGTIKPGEEGVLSFTAEEDVTFQSLWPGSSVMKPYTIKIRVTDE